MSEQPFAIGVDFGGTKIEVAHVEGGSVRRRLRLATDVAGGAEAVQAQIVTAVRSLAKEAAAHPLGVGVGVAGQIEPGNGRVHFAPNLHWHDVPLQSALANTLGLPVVVTNDVRAATWGEWLHGAGKGCDDLVCLFVGTGIGGGVVSGGRMLVGSTNSGGELGHVTVNLDGPPCHCPNRGCLEALASGWAIAEQARSAVAADTAAGAALLRLARGTTRRSTAGWWPRRPTAAIRWPSDWSIAWPTRSRPAWSAWSTPSIRAASSWAAASLKAFPS